MIGVIKKKISSFLILAFLLNVVLPGEGYSMTAPWWSGSQATDMTSVQSAPPGETSLTDNSKNQEKAGEPVSVHNGDFIYQQQDILIPSRAMPTEVGRTYKSQSRYNNRFGYGWDLSYNKKIIAICNGDLFYFNGELNRYRFIYIDGTDYIPPKGVYDKITQNPDGTYTLTERQGTAYKFDQNGRLTEIRDRNNNALHFSYDSAGKLPIIGKSVFSNDPDPKIIAYDYELVKVTDTAGREIALNYDANGRLISIVDFSGRVYTYAYDPLNNGDLVSFTTPSTAEYPAGLTTAYGYADHNLVTVTDARGVTYLTNHYDTYDRVCEQEYGGGIFKFSYDTAYSKTTITDPKGFVTEWIYDPDGSATSKKVYTAGLRPQDPDSYVTTYQRNNTLERTSITYPAGNGVKYTYDDGNPNMAARGNLLEIRHKANMAQPDNNSLDLVTTYTYESRFNFIKTMTDPKGYVTSYTYDYELPPEDSNYRQSGNIVKITYPTVNSITPETRFTYNAYGQIETITDPNGNVAKYEYYPDTGYSKKIIKGLGTADESITEFGYDQVGNIHTVKDPEGSTTTFDHNALNQLTRTTSPAPFNYITNYRYDQNGNLERVERETRDPSNAWQTTSYTYDIFDRVMTTTDDVGNVTTYGYDQNGNRNRVVDAENNVTDYVYDERDLLWKVILHNEGQDAVTEYAYDLNANLKEIKDAKSNTTSYDYDDFDRLQTTTYDNSSQEIYAYDKNSNLYTKTNRKGDTITYEYDELNRLRLKDLPDLPDVQYIYDAGSRLIDAVSAGKTLHYDHDNLNRVKLVTFPDSKTVGYDYDSAGNRTKLTYPDASFITYHYDKLNRLTDIKDHAVQTIAHYAYDALSRRRQADFLDGTSAIYDYDAINRLETLTNNLNGQTLTYSYTYDNVGNRKTFTSLRAPEGGEAISTYAYDDIYQLKVADYPDGFPNPDTTYNYDKLGNRTSTVSGGTTAYVPNNLNQYSQVGVTAYTYDLNGNLTSSATNTYSYDSENRLTSATTPSHTVTYTNCPFISNQKRIAKTVDGVTTKYLFDGDQFIAEYDGSGNLLRTFVYGQGIDELLMMKDAATGNKYYYHYDGLGSVMNLTDSTGAVAESYSYDVFGNITSPLSTVGNSYYFTGRQYDNETGLYYYRARYYDPKIGRFLQTDPMLSVNRDSCLGCSFKRKGLSSLTHPNLLHPYLYVDNNPVNWTDPYGLFKFWWWGDWGGPGYSGGKYQSTDDVAEEQKKKYRDARDLCYREHDYCYAGAVKETCKGGKKRDERLDACDRTLANCLLRLKLMGNSLITSAEIAFFYSGLNPADR
jgi:RHS repeat-associated protein